mmetsp:Transcript_54182/g.173712  ORF Transcript_54182/g.173712 Transcript_54182/m.173712 type:complete len:253 (-) Transcript_54182:107-865(-)
MSSCTALTACNTRPRSRLGTCSLPLKMLEASAGKPLRFSEVLWWLSSCITHAKRASKPAVHGKAQAWAGAQARQAPSIARPSLVSTKPTLSWCCSLNITSNAPPAPSAARLATAASKKTGRPSRNCSAGHVRGVAVATCAAAAWKCSACIATSAYGPEPSTAESEPAPTPKHLVQHLQQPQQAQQGRQGANCLCNAVRNKHKGPGKSNASNKAPTTVPPRCAPNVAQQPSPRHLHRVSFRAEGSVKYQRVTT